MNIPIEIYLQIFQHLIIRDVKQCLTVSKDWNAAATRTYFQTVTVTDHNVTILKSHLEDKRSFKHCNWTKALNISILTGRYRFKDYGETPPTNFTKEQFIKFITYFPNLKKIEVSNYVENKIIYLKYLLEVNSNEYLTQIEEIIFDRERLWNDCDMYSDLYFKYRASLRHVAIYHKPESFINSKYDGIINYLQQFRKLTHLKYVNTTDENISVYQLQVACPHLTMLDIYFDDIVPKHEAGTIGFCNPNNLKKLELSFPFISASYIDLIAEQLPVTVDYFSVTIHEIDIYDWMDIVGMDRMMKLINRMNKIKHVYLNCTPYKHYEVEHSADEESFMTTFYKFLHAFKGDRKMICSGNFNDFRSVHHHIDIENEELSFTYGLKYEDFYGNDESEEPVLDLAIPDKSASIAGLDIVNKLRFHVAKTNEDSIYKFLNYSLVNCPYLQLVEYKGMNSPRHEFIICMDTFNRFDFSRTKHDPSTTSQENLKLVKVKNFIPSSDFLNLLTSYLPNINSIHCSCDFYNHRLKEDDITIQIEVVDLSNFKCLETFYFNLKFMWFEQESSVCFIQFHYTDGDESYYQYIREEESFELRSVTSDFIKNHSSSSVSTITFKCEKIKKFIMYPDRIPRGLAEINYGGSPTVRPVDFHTEDTWYLEMI